MITSHARIDAPHLADGLFVLSRGVEGRAHRKNHIVSARWKDLTITFACVEPPGVLEQTVLLVLVAMAGIDGKRISPIGKSERGRSLHALLGAKNGAEHRDGIMVSTTIRQLVRECDLVDCGKAYSSVRTALQRLERVSLEVRSDSGDKPPSTHLLSYRQDGDGNIDVAMNYRIREALISTGFTRVSLIERRSLRSDVARIVHAFLSRWIAPKESRDVSLPTLAAHIWHDGLGSHKSVRRDRRARLRTALDEIKTIGGWTLTSRSDVVRITRGNAHGNSTHISTGKPRTPNGKTTHRAIQRTLKSPYGDGKYGAAAPPE